MFFFLVSLEYVDIFLKICYLQIELIIILLF